MDSADATSDGVYYGWVVVLSCFISTFVVFGLSYSFGVFLERMLAEFGATRGVTSIAFGIQTLLIYIGAVAVGVFADRYGARRMLAFGAGLLFVGLVMTSQATSLVTLVVGYGVVTGLGMSFIFVVGYATVPRWFDRRVGLAGGIASAGLGFGMVIVAPAATWLINQVGWRQSFLVVAVGVTFLLGIAALLIRDEPTEDTVPEAEFAEWSESSAPSRFHEQLDQLLEIAKSRIFILLFVGMGLVYTTQYIVFVHLVVHVIDIGFTRSLGAVTLAVIGGASIFGRVGIGYIADRRGRIRIFVLCSIVMGISTIALSIFGSPALLLAFAVVFGLVYGGNGALLAPLTADLFGRTNLNAVFGLVSTVFAVTGLAAPYFAGSVFDVLGTYDPAFIGSGILAIGGALAIATAGRLTERDG